jgi:hypothetical protein
MKKFTLGLLASLLIIACMHSSTQTTVASAEKISLGGMEFDNFEVEKAPI